jgi:hypothetical protein
MDGGGILAGEVLRLEMRKSGGCFRESIRIGVEDQAAREGESVMEPLEQIGPASGVRPE